MTNETYNGWTNRETWAVHLHISNNEIVYRTVSDLLKIPDSYTDPAVGTVHGDPAYRLKSFFEMLQLSIVNGESWVKQDIRSMLADIGSLWRVNWTELAKALKDAS